MKRHSNSFFLSLFVHLLLLAILFFIYKHLTLKKPEIQEKITCIELDCLSSNTAPLSSPKALKKPQKKIETKKVQAKVKRVVKKRVVKKKTVVVKKKKKVFKERVEEKTEPASRVQQEQVLQKTAAKQIVIQKSSTKPQKSPTNAKTLSTQEQYIKENLAKIRALLKENLYYPRRARKRGKEGVVKIRFRLSKDAEISNIQIMESKSDILSHGAIKTLENLSFKLPPPKEKLILNVPISYKLR